jgi:PIN domain nuclease of toxin-antitoxin system
MTKSPLLETHVWVWWMLGDPRLSARERTVLDDLPSGQRPRLCDISLWEVAMLVQLGRLRLDDALEDWLRIAASPSTVEVIPITPAVVAGGRQAFRVPPGGGRETGHAAHEPLISSAMAADVPSTRLSAIRAQWRPSWERYGF